MASNGADNETVVKEEEVVVEVESATSESDGAGASGAGAAAASSSEPSSTEQEEDERHVVQIVSGEEEDEDQTVEAAMVAITLNDATIAHDDSPIPRELIPKNAVDVSVHQNRKLWKVIISPGKKEVPVVIQNKMKVEVHYELWRADDPLRKIFYSSRIHNYGGYPTDFMVGRGEVLLALDEGVLSMSHLGERMLLIAHMDYAYSRYTRFHIPEALICVQVELLDAFNPLLPWSEGLRAGRSEETDDELFLETLRTADPPQKITDNSIVYVTVEGYFEGKMFFQRVTLPMDPCCLLWGFKGFECVPMPKGLAFGVKNLIVSGGSRGRVVLKNKATYDWDTVWRLDGNEKTELTIPKGQALVFIVDIYEVEEIFDPLTHRLDDLTRICEKLLRHGINYAVLKSYESAALKFFLVKQYLLFSDYKRQAKEVPDMLDYVTDLFIYFACMAMDKILIQLHHSQEERLKNLQNAIEVPKIQPNGQLMSAPLFERALLRFEAKQYEDALADFEEVTKQLESHFKVVDEMEKCVPVPIINDDKARIANEFRYGISLHVSYVIRKFCVWYHCCGGSLNAAGIDDASPEGKCVMICWEKESRRIYEQSKMLAKETKVIVSRKSRKTTLKKDVEVSQVRNEEDNVVN